MMTERPPLDSAVLPPGIRARFVERLVDQPVEVSPEP